MTFHEFKGKYAVFGAYSGWLTVSMAKESGLIPSNYHQFFADDCECGSENIISPMLTRETCCDPKCPVKVGYQLAEMFARCGVKGLGYATCRRIYRELREHDALLKRGGGEGIFHFDTFTEVLLLPWESYPAVARDTAKGREFFLACCEIREKTMTFSQMVGMLGLTDLGSNADRIFACADSFEEWDDQVKAAGGLRAFCAGIGVVSPDVVFSVAMAREAIAIAGFALQDSIRRRGMNEMKVCITGNVRVNGKGCTKNEYVDRCNAVCVDARGVQLLEVKNTSGPATSSFVLYSDVTSNRKYVTGAQRGVVHDEFGKHEVLMTATDFYNWLKGAMDEWNKRIILGNSNWADFYQILQEKLPEFGGATRRLTIL